MDNTHENGAANVIDEKNKVDNEVDEVIQVSSDEVSDANSESETEVVEVQGVVVEDCEVDELQGDEELHCDAKATETSDETNNAKAKGKKFAIVAGVGIGVALIGAGLLVNKRSAKLAYYVAKSII